MKFTNCKHSYGIKYSTVSLLIDKQHTTICILSVVRSCLFIIAPMGNNIQSCVPLPVINFLITAVTLIAVYFNLIRN